MSRLQRLYQATILEHNKNPRHYGVLESYSHHSHGKNPLCGDDFYLYILLDEYDHIQQISFVGKGCAISKASASMMAERVLGEPVERALKLKDVFLNMLKLGKPEDDAAILGSLSVFEGVCAFPVRVKCAALIWRALENAFSSLESTVVSTE